ncbi:MAG: TonB-dependent receptor [Xanthomonadales bacterium]|nr:TonB-dependent receptor [Xanthomonadales bacterium]MDH3925576.1 TonB-dependent receptor [Xanthomonadales bacterium]MDH3939879.1 TonB-dependent receptor [Xanthomonadales bacterium]MDH3999636.1 TonB-dependent receptor [Xanthomonadales bacterium]
MKNQILRLNPLSSSIALALGAVGVAPAIAQDSDADEAGLMEEVFVTGVRRSLIDSADIKRDSDGVVDAITAEDIGKFPDTNLAEAMSRITGVSIDRAAPGGPQGEGQRITVRGIGADYNLVLLNGRQMPASSILDTDASSSRAYNFANLAAESVAAVDVYKTSMADIPTGGIGATVNIRTARPFDMDDRVVSLGAKAVTDKSALHDSWTPEVSGIFADTFADGTFGVAISGVYQKRKYGYNQAGTTSGWRSFKGSTNDWGTIPQEGDPGSENIENRPGPDDTYSVPQNLNYSVNRGERKRLNGQLVLQWRPIEEVTATFDYTYSQLKVDTRSNDLSAWMNFGPSFSSWTDGPVAGPLFYGETYEGYPTDVAAGGAEYGVKTTNNSAGFNLEWIVRDGLTLFLDYHHSTAESKKNSPYGTNAVLGTAGFYRGTTRFDFRQDLPVLEMGTPEGRIEPDKHLTTGASFRNSYMKAKIDQLNLSGVYDLNDTMSLDFGYTYTKVNNRSAFSNVQYDDWGGNGSPDDYPNEVWTVTSLPQFFDNIDGSENPNLFPEFMFWDFETVRALAEAARGQTMFASDDFTTDRKTKEKTNSAYLQYLWTFDLGSMPSNFRAGIRYEKTKVTSSALVPIATKIQWAGTNEFNVLFADPDFTELKGDYDYFLPNFDFNIEFIDNLIGRASYSHTIGRPGWGDIQGGQTLSSLIRIDGGTGQQGDPGLKPLESKNIDLSLEWYYGTGSYLSAGYFRKKVDNYVGVTQITSTPFDLPHPGQGEWYNECAAATGGTDSQAIRQCIFDTYGDDPAVTITGVGANGFTTGFIDGRQGADPASTFDIQVPANQDKVKIDGWELAWQHVFGESGFGLIANYTFVDSDAGYDNASLNNQFAIEGLSNSANAVVFWENYGWLVRAAYNWRDKFLTARFDAGGNSNPLYVEAFGQLDGIVSYTFEESGVTLFVEGFNLTDETQRVQGRTWYNANYATQTGRRYGVGARWVF